MIYNWQVLIDEANKNEYNPPVSMFNLLPSYIITEEDLYSDASLDETYNYIFNKVSIINYLKEKFNIDVVFT